MKKIKFHFFVLLIPVFTALFSCSSSFNVNSYTEIKLCPAAKQSDADKNTTLDILNNRLKLYGGGTNHYRINLAGDTFVIDMDNKYLQDDSNINTIHYLLLSSGALEIYPVYGNIEMYSSLEKAYKIDARNNPMDSISKGLGPDVKNSLSGMLNVFTYKEGNTIHLANTPNSGYARGKDTTRINKILSQDSIRELLPRESKLLWGVKHLEGSPNIFLLYILNASDKDCALLKGNIYKSITSDMDGRGKPELLMNMNDQAAKTWAKITARNINKSLAFVIDDKVYYAPAVMNEITGGRSSIDANFTNNEINYLKAILSSGTLAAKLQITTEKDIEKR